MADGPGSSPQTHRGKSGTPLGLGGRVLPSGPASARDALGPLRRQSRAGRAPSGLREGAGPAALRLGSGGPGREFTRVGRRPGGLGWQPTPSEPRFLRWYSFIRPAEVRQALAGMVPWGLSEVPPSFP